MGLTDTQHYIKNRQINNTGNSIQYLVVILLYLYSISLLMEKQSIYIYVKLNHSTVHQKLIQYCKSIILQLKKEKDKKNVGAMGQETILENLE